MTPAQDAVVATIGARDVQVGFELGWVGNGDLEEHDPSGVRDVVVGQFLGRFLAVLGQVASIRLVRDDANRARPGVTEQPSAPGVMDRQGNSDGRRSDQ